MVLIVTEQKDVSTLEVIDYLRMFSIPYLVINESTKINLQNIIFQDGKVTFSLIVNDNKINSKDIKAFWFRRGYFNWDEFQFIKSNLKNNIVSDLYAEYQELEYSTLKNFIESMPNLNCIGSFDKREINKLEMLNQANEVNLMTPKTIISNSKVEVINFFRNKSIITKGIQVSPIIISDFGRIKSYTESINAEDLPEHFSFSLFQEEIAKKIEIRSFYLNNEVYSMAIFSQNDEKTSVDFRKYNNDKPNRMVPFKLPFEIESKLINLSKLLGLNCGSADFLLSQDNEYYFLEINPIGQYQFLDYYCNYFINKKIALSLA